jgi:hypothetical protein
MPALGRRRSGGAAPAGEGEKAPQGRSGSPRRPGIARDPPTPAVPAPTATPTPTAPPVRPRPFLLRCGSRGGAVPGPVARGPGKKRPSGGDDRERDTRPHPAGQSARRGKRFFRRASATHGPLPAHPTTADVGAGGNGRAAERPSPDAAVETAAERAAFADKGKKRELATDPQRRLPQWAKRAPGRLPVPTAPSFDRV